MELKISTLTLEAFLLVLVRTGGFIVTAPLFSHKSINTRLRILIAGCIAITLFASVDFPLPEYDTVFGYTVLVVKELLIGLSLGFVSSIVMAIIVMAGEFIDREIGFSMATTFDPSMGTMVTITAELYDKMLYLVILITNLHFYILRALAQSFDVVPLGHVNINYGFLFTEVLSFMGQYFSIGFRIAMPIFLSTIILNVILGVISKSSPQMNMFAIGMQLKVLGGLLMFSIIVLFIPNIANYLVEKMNDVVMTVLGGL